MTHSDNIYDTKKNEILKKRLSNMILKETSKGLDSHEMYIKRTAIKQLAEMNHQKLHQSHHPAHK